MSDEVRRVREEASEDRRLAHGEMLSLAQRSEALVKENASLGADLQRYAKEGQSWQSKKAALDKLLMLLSTCWQEKRIGLFRRKVDSMVPGAWKQILACMNELSPKGDAGARKV